MLFRFREYVFAQSFHRSIEKLLHYSILWFFIHWWSRLISFFEHFDISKTNRVDNLIFALLFESHRYKFEISTSLFEKIVAIDSEFDDCFRFFSQKSSYDLIVETNRSQNSLYQNDNRWWNRNVIIFEFIEFIEITVSLLSWNDWNFDDLSKRELFFWFFRNNDVIVWKQIQ